MTIKDYMNPDFTIVKKIIYLAITALAVFLSVYLIYGLSRLKSDKKTNCVNENYQNLLLRFFELIISATSVMSFACAYVVFNHVYALCQGATTSGVMRAFLKIWGDWKDFALLFLICITCVINTILDKMLIPLKGLDRDQIAVIRMMGMFYAIIILLFLNVIGDESEYSPVMMYYLGLMVGRFVYFDASFVDFLKAMKNMLLNLPILVLGLTVSGSLTFIGFSLGYFLEQNYYIMGVFYTHLFLLVVVFLFYHVQRLIFRKEVEDDCIGDDTKYRDCNQ